jgi:hypothetical protein
MSTGVLTLDLRRGMRVRLFARADFREVADIRPQGWHGAIVEFTDGTAMTIGRDAEWEVEAR